MALIRRTFIAACASAAVTLTAGHAMAAPKEVKLGYALAVNSHYGAAAKAWADSVEKATNNAFAIKHFPSSALGGERELIEGLQLGTVEAAIVSTGALSNFVSDVGIVDIPFLFRDTQHARAVLDGKFGQDLLAKFQQRGLVALAWGEQGFRHLTNNKVSVQNVADLKGLKIRVTENPVHITAFRTLGAAPTPMSWPEVISALQQGTIDGQENPISVLTSSKLWEVQKHLTLTSHVYAPVVLVLSPSFWGSLTDAQKAAFTEGAKAGAQASRAFVDDVEAKGVEMAKSNGMQVVENVDAAAFRAALEPAYKQYAKKFGQQTLDAIANVK
ncbi:TRAP transporter substrate-binding protein [Comamonas kerstersii]|jgi:tripartite ATP-independent transporter DctP family solute receptor|uniref:C4-dicarboxylate ABC transporter substrate-binding protein n=1 Tax=Comamonas kerstersii TaxID=225992 RepID=A0A0W7YWZ9_9BURK|nr:TRAP transporter substrate-binding protein [Comamonas kerstersii]MDO4968849.1 TRAP transporter substrate-binding protein [Comamonadaceae bacterium]AQZ99545.1 C4-dicarboxylate ABC transporter substrate-binding protein [Comamonas kerstersii]KUF39687.1 C4-dicarboxylate ABC transporter substrate-binding protein [Comamonas kerstersii]OOH87884.1 C4-dicarboxylate ABC transporter substrate-binding protein [Comamonas kerstersii]OOH94844.1 C4-dicarboxylate ABC transporter substrate-binding protein [C